MNKIFTKKDKYTVVAEMLRDCRGSLLDIGARDRHLANKLNLQQIKYYSADICEGHDYTINLETNLNFPDSKFDYVVALDVLEHVNRIHLAFSELARITRLKFIVALPNMATLNRRYSFLRRGHLGTEKYNLNLEGKDDRHRWLTVYPEINKFCETNAKQAGFELEQIFEEFRGNRFLRWFMSVFSSFDLIESGLFTERCICIMSRKNISGY